VILALAGPLLWRRLDPRARIAGAVVLFVGVTVLALSPASYLGVGRTGQFAASASGEINTYQAFHTIVDQVTASSSPASRTLVWYATEAGGLGGVGALVPNVGGTLDNFAVRPSFGRLGELERERLANPTTARVLLVAPSAGVLSHGRRTVARSIGGVRAGKPRSLAEGAVRTQMLEVRGLAPGGTRDAVRLSVRAVLAAWRQHDDRRLCWLSVPELVVSLTSQDGTCRAGVSRALTAHAPPAGAIRSIAISDDTARVGFDGEAAPLILQRITSEWLVSGGAAPWTGG
jgi:hypothetical protein